MAIDWERLEAEIADAVTADRLANRVVRAVRRRRLRGRALLAGAACAATALVTVPVLVAGTMGNTPLASARHEADAPRGGGPQQRRTESVVQPVPTGMRRTRCGPAVLLAVLLAAGCASDTSGHGPAGGGGSTADQTKILTIALGGGGTRDDARGRVYVDDHYCRIIDRSRRGPCVVRPIPAAVRHGVLTVVGDEYRFVSRMPDASRTRVVVALGAPVIRGDRATIAVDSMCGPLCGAGMRIHLRRAAGHWHEVGSREQDWIS